jgi:hypothetical protein
MFWLHQDKDVSKGQQRNTVLIRPQSWVRDSTECILAQTYKIPDEKGWEMRRVRSVSCSRSSQEVARRF